MTKKNKGGVFYNYKIQKMKIFRCNKINNNGYIETANECATKNIIIWITGRFVAQLQDPQVDFCSGLSNFSEGPACESFCSAIISSFYRLQFVRSSRYWGRHTCCKEILQQRTWHYCWGKPDLRLSKFQNVCAVTSLDRLKKL